MRSIRVLLSLGAFVFAATQLWAIGPQHYYVSSDGAGVLCTFDSPCLHWQDAINIAATGDEITALTGGDFGPIDLEGDLGLTIDGGGLDAGVLGYDSTSKAAVSVGVGKDVSVRLRGLHLNAGGNADAASVGIEFGNGVSLVIEDCKIENYGKRGISVESNVDGAKVFVTNTIIADQGFNGIVVVPPSPKTTYVFLDHVQILNSAHAGVGVNPNSAVQIRDSVISNNGAWGLLAQGPPALVSMESTSLFNNPVAIQANGGAVVNLSDDNVWGNVTGLIVSSGTINSFGNNRITGNVTDGAGVLAPKSLR